MLRLMVGAFLLVGSGMACVSDESGSSGAPPYPIYRVHEARPLVARPRKRAAPRAVPRRQYTSEWSPRSGRISRRWTHIVIHHSATENGGAKGFDKYHRQKNGWDELGYHFVIGNGTDTPDGFVEVGSRWQKQKHGAHCKTPDNYFNEHGIGICLVGDFTKTRPTSRQVASLKRLVRFLSDARGISPDRVISHRTANRTTQCPGRYFKLSDVRRAMSLTPTASVMP